MFNSLKIEIGGKMYKKIIIACTIMVWFTQAFAATPDASIASMSGNVKVRYGVGEEWNNASVGLLLRYVDTILTGKDGQVRLKLENGREFTLGSNSVLDISDLMVIKDKELFVFLMTQKIRKIEVPDSITKLRVGNVTLVHGDSKSTADSSLTDTSRTDLSQQEFNGAFALYSQDYYANTIVKLNKILNKYDYMEKKGKILYYIAKSFDALDMKGQAQDSYKTVINFYLNKDSLSQKERSLLIDAQAALKKFD